MPAVFVIYLIQEHEAVRATLWNVVNITKWAESVWLIPIILLVFIVLFVIALLLNTIYQLAHKLFINKIETAIVDAYDKTSHKINDKLSKTLSNTKTR